MQRRLPWKIRGIRVDGVPLRIRDVHALLDIRWEEAEGDQSDYEGHEAEEAAGH